MFENNIMRIGMKICWLLVASGIVYFLINNYDRILMLFDQIIKDRIVLF